MNTVLGGVKGKKIEVLVEDDSGTPEKGVSGYRKLVSQDHVVAVIGQFHSSVMLAVQKLADQMGVPVFATQASAAAITSNKLATTFRTHAIDSDRVTMWMAYIKSKGWKRIAILAENTDFGIGLVDETEQRNKEDKAGLELKNVIFDRTSVDFSAQLLDVKAWKPDLVINIGLPPAGLVLVKQAADVGLFPKTPMLASFDFPVRPEYWKTVGEAGTYISFISYYHPAMKRTALGDWFAKRYQEVHKEPPVYAAFNAFAQAVIVSQALAKTQTGTPAELISALESGSYQSWNGTVTFTRGPKHWHQWSAPMMVLQHVKPNISYEQDPIIYPPELKTADLIVPK